MAPEADQPQTRDSTNTKPFWRTHGGVNKSVLGECPRGRQLIDFSVNLNYYGPAPSVREAVLRSAPWSYPNPDYPLLKERLKERHPGKSIVVGNGAADLIWSIAQTFVGRQFHAAIIEPTFCEFRAAWLAALTTAGTPRERLHSWRGTSAEGGFALELSSLWQWLADLPKPLIVYWCNPNSPTGSGTMPHEIFAGLAGLKDTVILLDEAFLSLSDLADWRRNLADGRSGQEVPDQVIQLRSMTKDHALAGVRLGYMAASYEITAWVEGHRPPWMLSTVAYDAALAALNEDAFVAQCWQKIRQDRQIMVAHLTEAGYRPVPTTTIYMLLPVPSGSETHRALLRRGVLVRDTSSYGLDGYIRVCTRPLNDVFALVEALTYKSN